MKGINKIRRNKNPHCKCGKFMKEAGFFITKKTGVFVCVCGWKYDKKYEVWFK